MLKIKVNDNRTPGLEVTESRVSYLPSSLSKVGC